VERTVPTWATVTVRTRRTGPDARPSVPRHLQLRDRARPLPDSQENNVYIGLGTLLLIIILIVIFL
jgi:hypothetical protein